MNGNDAGVRQNARIVVKVGTNIIADRIAGLNLDRINFLARGVSHLRSAGHGVVLVSSGAIGAGMAARRLTERPRSMPEKQATAAIGQPILMEAYEAAFRRHTLSVAQILLTREDVANRGRYRAEEHD